MTQHLIYNEDIKSKDLKSIKNLYYCVIIIVTALAKRLYVTDQI